MLTWTNQPYESMWNNLRFLQSEKNVEGILDGSIKTNRNITFPDPSVIPKKAKQISYAIKQADEYFEASESVSIATSPLLLFYGMLSLAKALIVANSESLLLGNIKYHGLFTRPITPSLQQYSEDPSSWNMSEEFAVTNDGVINELLSVLYGWSLPKNSIIKFVDILQGNPELRDQFSRYVGLPSNTFPLYSETITKNPFKIEVNPSTTDADEFLKCFDFISNDFYIADDFLHKCALRVISRDHVKEAPEYFRIYHALPGGRYIVGGLKYEEDGIAKRKYMSPEVSDYIGMFILGDIVRYKQEFWGSVISGEKDGFISMLNLFVQIAKQRFPNFILSAIFKEKFEYGTASRWM